MSVSALTVISVVVLLIALGFASVKGGLFAAADMALFGRYVVTLALPALIVRAFSGRDLGAVFDAGFVLAYAAASLCAFAIGYGWSRLLTSDGEAAAVFRGMGSACPNTGFIGYPLLVLAMPGQAAQAFALAMAVENLLVLPLILTLAERSRATAGSARMIAWRLVRNPLVLALAVGVILSASGTALPDWLARPVDLVAQSGAAVALLAVGGMLAGLPRGAIGLPVLGVVAGKLLIHPLLVLLALAALLHLNMVLPAPGLAAALLLLSAMPAMTIYPLLASAHGQGAPAAAALLLMTVGSIGSAGVLLTALGL